MLISCPYCGARDVSEFTYQGDGNRARPDPQSQDIGAWNDYIYDRVNVAGEQNEIWQHSGGCRSHLRVMRNTLIHKISTVSDVRAAVAKAEKPARPPTNMTTAAAKAPVAAETTLAPKASAAKARPKASTKRSAK